MAKVVWIAAVLLGFGVGCTQSESNVDDPEAEPQDCVVDADCAAGICARTHECIAANAVRAVHVEWTIAHKEADASTCFNGPDIIVEFKTEPEPSAGELAAFGPMDCVLGRFTVDKLPTRFWIGGVRNREAGMWLPLDESGTAKLDLPF